MTRECVEVAKLRLCRDISKFVRVLMMYYDSTEIEKDRFDSEMCYWERTLVMK